jgi:hypothetical protein
VIKLIMATKVAPKGASFLILMLIFDIFEFKLKELPSKLLCFNLAAGGIQLGYDSR